jgi:proline iminopeptidase
MAYTGSLQAQVQGVVPADEVNLHYTIYGEGTPVLLLSGGPGISGAYFEPLAQALQQTYQAIVLDQRGTGTSILAEVNTSTINFDTYIQDLEDLRIHLELEQWVLLGHSWGGILSMAYASRYPDRVQTMVLVGSGGINTDFMKYYSSNIMGRLSPSERDMLAYWQNPARFATADPDRIVFEVSRISAPAMVFDRADVYPLMEQTLQPEAFNATVNLVMTQQWYLNGYDFRESLSTFESPVLILQGRQDPIGESTAYQIKQTLPNATLTFIEQSGHWPFVEQKDAFLQLVREFLP